jgi:hypothetical protein
MTNRFDIPGAAAVSLDDTVAQDAQDSAGLEPGTAPDGSSGPGQDDGSGFAPSRMQAFQSAPSYRRSLFRR